MFKAYGQAHILILGGLGFIGTHLTRLLHKAGAKITVVDNFLPDHGANWFNLEGIRDDITVHVSDIRSKEAMNTLVQGQDYIFNIAAQTSHSDSMKDPYLDLDINGRGTLNVLEACRHYNSEAKVVFIGTRAYYGSPKILPVTEDAPLNPLDIYSVNRYAAEQYHLLYNLHYGLKTTSLRISNLYGPYAQMKHAKYNVLNYFMRMAIDGQSIKIFGDGLQQRDYVYVADVARALALAGLEDKSVGEIYNIGSGEGESFANLVKLIVKTAQSGDYQYCDWPTGSQNFDVGDFIMDISKAQKELAWQPEYSLEQGFKETLNFYKAHQSHYWL